MSADVVRRRFPVGKTVTCAGCGKLALEHKDPPGRLYLYRYRPFRGAPLVCSRECDILARPPLELEGTGGPR